MMKRKVKIKRTVSASQLCMPSQSAASAVEDNVDDDGDVYYDGTDDPGAYYTAKLTFSRIFPSKFGYVLYKCPYYIRIFTVLRTRRNILNNTLALISLHNNSSKLD